MSWIAEYDTRGREFPTCVHVTKTTDFMTHGATYVPIEDGKAVRDENARLREVVADGELHAREILAENAKLRKLCADMHVTLDGMNEQSFSVSGYVFCADVCPHWMGECSMLHPDECWYEQALRELGVEVDS